MNNIPNHVRPGGTSYVSPEGIIYCTDGKMRWVYEIDQHKNPTVLWAQLRKYVGVCAVVGALILLVQGCTGGGAALLGALPVALGLLAAGVVLAAVSYASHLMQNGRLVCLVYTLDEQSITCQQVKGKNDKEKVTHAFAVWVGGQSQPAVRVSSLHEMGLADVRAISECPARSCIKLRGKKGIAVHATEEQFQTVLDSLRKNCTQVK